MGGLGAAHQIEIGGIGQAFDHHRHLVRRKVFVNHRLEMNRPAAETGPFLEGPIQGFLRHGDFARLLHQQAQTRIGGRVGPMARGNHDFLGQLFEQLAPGIGGQLLAFCFPLRTHVLCSLML